MDDTQGKAAPGSGGDVTNFVEELAEFEFTPITPSEETDPQEQMLLVGNVRCR